MRPFPHGAIALVEPGYAHKTFLEVVRPRYALIKLHHANRLLKRDETAASWFPDETQVIVSSTILDHRNKTIPLEHNGHRRGEVDIVKQFAPDYHIPADRSDYLEYPDDYRYEKTRECMVGTMTVQNHITDAGLDTKIIPLIKTATRKERALCYATVNQLGLDYAALYCNNYFNDGRGRLTEELLADLEMIADETKEQVDTTDSAINVLTLSCQSPNVLSRMCDAVVAGSGQMVGAKRRWRESITPTKQTAERINEIYRDIETRVAEALDVTVDCSRYTPPETNEQHESEPSRTDEVV